jgi:hypothetical protein
MKKLKDFLTVNKYYKMDNHNLELEASKYKIGGYASSRGTVIRERIIEQLLAKDLANNSRFAVFISALALLISVISIILSLMLNR